jgi:hypothetical protein
MKSTDRLSGAWHSPMRGLHLLAPLAIAAAYVLSLYGSYAIPLDYLWRPLAITLAAAVLIEAASLAILGAVWGVLVASLAVSALLAIWPIAACLSALCIWWIAINALRRSRRVKPLTRSHLLNLVRGLGVASIILLLLTVVSAGSNLRLGGRTVGPPAAAGEGGPNVYLVLLDGYPRADTLKDAFGFDNGAFIQALEKRGFDVAGASRSNYSRTWLTLATMFHMEYADQIEGLAPYPADPIEQHRRLMLAIDAAPALKWLAGRGYTLISIAPPFVDAGIRNVHEFVDTGQLNTFELQLLRNSTLAEAVKLLAPSFVPDQLRERIAAAFDRTADYARQSPSGPKLLFTHVMSPHPPFLYGRLDQELGPPECFPATCGLWVTVSHELGISPAAYAAAMGAQIAALNERILALADAIVSNDPQAVVILFSDHGARHDRENEEEFVRDFFAARTPGHTAVFPEDVHLVNVFPHLFSAYFGVDSALKDYAGWISIDASLNLQRVD